MCDVLKFETAVNNLFNTLVRKAVTTMDRGPFHFNIYNFAGILGMTVQLQ